MGVWDSLLYQGFSLAIGVTGTEALANTFSLDPLGSVQWRFVMAADHPLAEEELMSIILQTGLQQFTPTTLVDMPTLLKDLEQARELGYTCLLYTSRCV